MNNHSLLQFCIIGLPIVSFVFGITITLGVFFFAKNAQTTIEDDESIEEKESHVEL